MRNVATEWGGGHGVEHAGADLGGACLGRWGDKVELVQGDRFHEFDPRAGPAVNVNEETVGRREYAGRVALDEHRPRGEAGDLGRDPGLGEVGELEAGLVGRLVEMAGGIKGGVAAAKACGVLVGQRVEVGGDAIPKENETDNDERQDEAAEGKIRKGEGVGREHRREAVRGVKRGGISRRKPCDAGRR